MTRNGEFFDQFIEDYFAESGEHLATTRRVLLELESTTAAGAPEPRLLRDLFRSLHTLKGLSGMVGDAGTERTAHALEDALRAVDPSTVRLPGALLDALFAGVELLERCIAARRGGAPDPDVDPVIRRLEAMTPAGRAESDRPAGIAPERGVPEQTGPVGSDASGHGHETVVYHFEFVPSTELTARGVGVDAVRARLRSLGTILDVRPRMEDGGLVFDFRVSTVPARHPDDAWADDGLRWRLVDDETDDAPSDSIPPAIAPAAAAQPASTSAPPSVARVELARLDAVMRLVGELVVSRSRLDDLVRRMSPAEGTAVRDGLEETSAALERQIRQLRESVMRIRLVPVGEVFERLRFAARDAIRESGKQVQLVLRGQNTEIDKLVVDRMLEPLLHLVRNAVSHGVEPPADRVARGKPAQGTLTLSAAASGDRILIDVEDDGAGIDIDSVASRARARGLLADAEALTADRLLDVLCAPGFSTRDAADMTSGRGVGMDVVRSTVRALAGDLALETTPGRGTRFVIELPLTLMILDALVVEIGDQQMAVPQTALREVLQVDPAAIVTFEHNEVLSYRGGVLPVIRLSRLFNVAAAPRASVYLLVVGSEAAPVGLMVERLVGLREIVVHPVTDPLVAVAGIGGATELADGRVSLILDTAALLRLAYERRDRRARPRPALTAAGAATGASAWLSAS